MCEPKAAKMQKARTGSGRRDLEQRGLFATTCTLGVLVAALAFPGAVGAFGDSALVQLTPIAVGSQEASTHDASRRLAWEVRQRTNVETSPPNAPITLTDTALVERPLLYLRGSRAFDPLTEAEEVALRRHLTFGGTLLIDNAAGDASGGNGFDQSVRRLVQSVLGQPLVPLRSDHVLYRTYYLVGRPVGRVTGPAQLEVAELRGRVAVVYSRHDLGGAWARDNLGNWLYPATPGGASQRESAIRLGVNLFMYATTLDYKDDQVHAPYLMRRRAGDQ